MTRGYSALAFVILIIVALAVSVVFYLSNNNNLSIRNEHDLEGGVYAIIGRINGTETYFYKTFLGVCSGEMCIGGIYSRYLYKIYKDPTSFIDDDLNINKIKEASYKSFVDEVYREYKYSSRSYEKFAVYKIDEIENKTLLDIDYDKISLKSIFGVNTFTIIEPNGNIHYETFSDTAYKIGKSMNIRISERDWNVTVDILLINNSILCALLTEFKRMICTTPENSYIFVIPSIYSEPPKLVIRGNDSTSFNENIKEYLLLSVRYILDSMGIKNYELEENENIQEVSCLHRILEKYGERKIDIFDENLKNMLSTIIENIENTRNVDEDINRFLGEPYHKLRIGLSIDIPEDCKDIRINTDSGYLFIRKKDGDGSVKVIYTTNISQNEFLSEYLGKDVERLVYKVFIILPEDAINIEKLNETINRLEYKDEVTRFFLSKVFWFYGEGKKTYLEKYGEEIFTNFFSELFGNYYKEKIESSISIWLDDLKRNITEFETALREAGYETVRIKIPKVAVYSSKYGDTYYIKDKVVIIVEKGIFDRDTTYIMAADLTNEKMYIYNSKDNKCNVLPLDENEYKDEVPFVLEREFLLKKEGDHYILDTESLIDICERELGDYDICENTFEDSIFHKAEIWLDNGYLKKVRAKYYGYTYEYEVKEISEDEILSLLEDIKSRCKQT